MKFPTLVLSNLIGEPVPGNPEGAIDVAGLCADLLLANDVGDDAAVLLHHVPLQRPVHARVVVLVGAR